MQKISKAALKRFFESNIGREVTAVWPAMRGNLGTTVLPDKSEARTVHQVRSGDVVFQAPCGLSYLTVGKGNECYMGEGKIEMHYNGELRVTYLIQPEAQEKSA